MEDIKSISIKIASPEDILSWSYGEVIKPETINYRTQRPEKDGLFSERIFGPTKDWECYCGKYRKIRYKGVICDKCGVEVTRSVVRRERMGHIKLAAPVAHIWFLRTVPSRLSLLLDVSLPQLEKVVYYVAYVVINVHKEKQGETLKALDKEFKIRKDSKNEENAAALSEGWKKSKDQLKALKPGMVLSEADYRELSRKFGDVFDAGSGAEAVKKLLEKMDLNKEAIEIQKEFKKSVKDSNRRKRLIFKLRILKAMIASKMRPEWMILTVLPVLPPDLRPMVALDGGRYATSDANDLYRRVINRNNRLKKLMELKAPEVIVVNEKRMLQEAVDALIDNTARAGIQQASAKHRPLRSLADMLKGKQGRFRQNLLGKRVDYSGRSVIVVGPELRINECGLPKKMALEIFRPFVINKIIERGLAHNIKNANRLIEQTPPDVWAILEEVSRDKKVLLNRAPTLHRLGIQAFKPLLIEDLAIRIPPLVCTAFNADFDGDQMAVHLPLSEEAQKEASELMAADRNLLKPATGDPITTPTQDVVLGCYYLTRIQESPKGKKAFSSFTEVMAAYENNLIGIQTPIKFSGRETSYGRLIFNQILPEDFGFVNETLNKKKLSGLVARIIDEYGIEKAGHYLNEIKNLGFRYSSLSSVTWGMDDLKVPGRKKEIVEQAEKEVAATREQYEAGMLTEAERKAKVISIWNKANAEIAKLVPANLNAFESVYSIIDSGARGSWSQPNQMMGMKGLVQDPQGRTIELPVRSSYKEGFTVLEYFIATHGARKGESDTALKTASAGYLTRRLVDVSQDLIIREKNCGTREGIEIFRKDGEEYGYKFGSRLFSRTALQDIKIGNKVVVKAGEIISRKAAEEIEKLNLESAEIRSPITCKTLHGICAACYGLDLGRNRPSQIGETVGVIAAQSIGEPGTQLTLRTFHAGGIAGLDITHGLPRVEEIFEARLPKGKAVLCEADGLVIAIEEEGGLKKIKIKTVPSKSKKEGLLEYLVPRIVEVFVAEGDRVEKGTQICEGHLDIKELLSYKSVKECQRYILNEVQKIYIPEGASINDKHIEIIIRKMFSKVSIKDPGDSEFLPGEIIDKSTFLEKNREIKRKNGEPARARQTVMGITRVALSTESFLSAASFQETSRVLVAAATEAKSDELRGLKENVIIGRLIPLEGKTRVDADRENL